jgi:hypothetical protein
MEENRSTAVGCDVELDMQVPAANIRQSSVE